MDEPSPSRYSHASMIPEQAIALATRDGVALEARLSLPPGASHGVVICHPHPLYGGDMENPVVVRAAEVCGALGLATLRFNFRGVGGSTGVHGGGRAEMIDVDTARRHLAGALAPPAAVALVGYSFGAAVVAAGAAEWPEVAGVALVAPPLGLPDYATFPRLDGRGHRLLLVAGSRDPYCPQEALERLGRAAPGAMVRVVAEADHFFLGKLFPLGEIVAEWARGLGPR